MRKRSILWVVNVLSWSSSYLRSDRCGSPIGRCRGCIGRFWGWVGKETMKTCSSPPQIPSPYGPDVIIQTVAAPCPSWRLHMWFGTVRSDILRYCGVQPELCFCTLNWIRSQVTPCIHRMKLPWIDSSTSLLEKFALSKLWTWRVFLFVCVS